MRAVRNSIIFFTVLFTFSLVVISWTPLRYPYQKKKAKLQVNKGKVQVYDENADAEKDIAAALQKAKKENKRVLIQWGGNWCGWCVKLHDLFKQNRKIARKILYEYEVVYVDLGKINKNIDVAKKYDAYEKFKKAGVPYLTILDADGNVVINHDTGSLEKGKQHDPEKVLAFLTKYAAKYADANKILQAGVTRAKNSGKNVFIHFGAPRYGWCKKLDTWLDRKNVAAIWDKYFVSVKIDVDRTIGGKKILRRFLNGKKSGIPWSAILDGHGKMIVNSSIGGTNFGFPAKEEEIETFGVFLKKGSKKIKNSEIQELLSSLKNK